MLSHVHYLPTTILHAHLHLNTNPNPNPYPLFLSIPSPKSLISNPHASTNRSSAASLAPDVELAEISRRQNARSTALLLHDSHPPIADHAATGAEDEEEWHRTKILEEMSIATKKAPRFPGAVGRPGADRLTKAPNVQGLLDGDERALQRALEIRRGVAAECLKVALRAAKLSVTYSNNLVSRLADFVDRVVVGAAALKGDPEFAHLSFNSRAKSYIQSSGIVPLVKWLKHNSMSYPQIGKVVCRCSGDLEPVRRVVEWLRSIHVKGEFLGSVLVKAGPIWERDESALVEIVDYLEKKGVRRDWVGFVVSRCPQVLSLTMEDLEARVRFYFDMGMDEEAFGTMVFDYPRVLGFFSLEVMNSKVNYLKEFGLSSEDVGQLIAFKPQLMGCSIEERWKPLVKYLYYLGVPRDGMRKMLRVKPMIFCVDLETTIAPKVRFLQDIGIREEAIGSVLVRFPPLLTYSLYKKIRPVVIFLMTKAGVTQRDIGKVIALDPQLVGCSIIQKLEVNVKYFLSLGIRLQSLGEMLADFPMLLRYNIDVLRPKYRYLRRTMVRPLQDLIEFPRFFSYSLEGRIIPRHKILVENRINFKLRYMLASTDDEFDQKVSTFIEQRKKFESGNTGADFPSPVTPNVTQCKVLNSTSGKE